MKSINEAKCVRILMISNLIKAMMVVVLFKLLSYDRFSLGAKLIARIPLWTLPALLLIFKKENFSDSLLVFCIDFMMFVISIGLVIIPVILQNYL